MGREVESRVVEMSFDNQNFEKNVSTSMNTLEKLKKALDLKDAEKGFNKVDDASKKINFDKLVSAAETLEKRFSVFGEIGATALQRVTNSMMDLATKTMNFLTSGITQGGLKRAMNLEQADFQLQGLLKDTEAVAAIMENVNWSVDGTAYGLDAAAKAASMFAATGMRAGEEMKGALRGVAGVAAMTNSEYEDIARIFTTVAGQGKVMADQYNQLASRGLNAAATIANYLTKVGDGAKVTEAQVREMTSNGKIDFATFAAAMDDAFGEHAKAANKTFTGAMSNIRAALARIGADFISPIIKQDKEMVWLLNWIRIKINEIRKLTTPFANEVTTWLKDVIHQAAVMVKNLDFSAGSTAVRTVQNSFQGLMNIVTALKNVFLAVGTSFKEVFPQSAGQIILDLSYKFAALTEKLNPSVNTFGAIRDISKAVFLVLKDGIEVVKMVANAISSFVSNALGGLNINILDIPRNIAKAIISFKEMNQGVNLFLVPIGALASAFETAKTKVKEWVNAFKEIPIVQEIINNFAKITAPFVDLVKELGSGAKDAIGKFIDAFKEMDGISFESTKALFDKLRDIFSSSVTDLVGTIKKIPEIFASVKPAISEQLSNISALFQKFWTSIKSIFSKIGAFFTDDKTVAGIVSMIFGVGSVATGVGLIKVLNEIKTNILPLVQAVPRLINSITSVFYQLRTSIQELTKGIMFEKVSNGIFTIAKAIALLGGTLVVLAQVPVENLQTGGTAMLLIATAMAALVAAFSKLDSAGKVDIKGVASTMIGMAASMFILAGTLGKLANLEGDIMQGVALITILIAEMVGAMLLLGKNQSVIGKDQKVTTATISMLSFATSMSSLVKTMSKIAAMPLDEAVSSIAIMTILIVEMVAMMKLTSGNSWQSGVGMLALTVSVHVLIAALDKIGDMDMTKLAKAELVMISISAILKLLSGALSAGHRSKNSDSAANVGAGLLATAAAMLLLGYAVEKLGALDLGTLAKGIAAVGILTVFLDTVIIATKFAGENAAKVSVTLLAVAAAVAILGGIIIILGQLDTAAVVKGTAAVSALMAMFALIIVSTKLAGECKATLIIVTIAVGMLAAALGVLAAVEPDRVLPASIALSMVMAMFALIVASTAVAKNANVTIAIMALVVAELAGILAALSFLNTEAMLPAAEALSLLLLALTASFVIISNAKEVSIESVAALAAMGIVIAEIAIVLGVLAALNIEPSLETAESLSLVLLAMTASLSILAKMNVGISAAAEAALALSAFVGILGGVMVAIGALMEYVPGLEGFLDKGIEVLIKIGEGLGRFAGAIIGGLIDQIASYLPSISTNLSLFMMNLTPFIVGAKTIDSSVVDGVVHLAGAIIAISAAQVIQGITNLLPFTGTMSDFGETLNELGSAMVQYSKTVSGKIDAGAVEASATAAQALAELQKNLPKTGGFWQEIFGESMDMGTFGENLEAFGKCLVNYSKAITADGGINTEAIRTSAEAVSALTDLQNNLPKTGGFFQEIFGENMSMDDFGQNLEKFGASLVAYSKAITADSGIDVKAIQNSAKAAQGLADLQNSLPTVGGKFQEWFGETMNIDEFGVKIVAFGACLVAYCMALNSGGGIDVKLIGESAKAAAKLVELQNALPEESGWFQEFFGGGATDIAEWGEKLKSFGAALVHYCALLSLGSLSVDLVQESVDCATLLIELTDAIPKEEGPGAGKLVTFGNTVKEFGYAFDTAATSLTNVDHNKLSSAIKDIEALVNVCTKIMLVNTNSMNNFAKGLKTLANNAIKNFVGAFNDSEEQVNGAIDKFIGYAEAAIDSNQNRITDAIDALVGASLDKVNSRQSEFTKSGNGLIQQLITGYQNKKASATSKINEILTSCVQTISGTFPGKFLAQGVGLIQKTVEGFASQKPNSDNKITEIMTSGVKIINSKQGDYKTASTNVMNSYVSAITAAIPKATTMASNLATNACKAISSKERDYNNAGSNLMLKLSAGMESKKSNVSTASSNVAKAAHSAANSYAENFYNTGSNYGSSMASGINATAYKAIAAAKALASSIDQAVRNSLDINSPSKVAHQTGEYYGDGFVNAIVETASRAYKAAKRMATEASEGLTDALDSAIVGISDSLNLNPVITPEVDASKALATASQINSLFNGGTDYTMSSRIRDSQNYQNQNGNSDRVVTANGSVNYQFVQNNYSPKALSRIDIYRQTKNQFTTFKEATVRA